LTSIIWRRIGIGTFVKEKNPTKRKYPQFFDLNILEENGNRDFCEGKTPNKEKIPTKGIK
jgi:hypothetical protein